MLTFPVWGVQDSQCGCGQANCTSPGKHPMVKNWQQGAPLTEGQNYGIVTGAPSGVVVIDQDSGEFHDYETFTVKTPKGFHYYFRHPGFPVRNSVKEFSSTCDIRGDGGYVVGPGSIGIAGEYRVLVDRQLGDLPPWSGYGYSDRAEGFVVEPREPDARIVGLAEEKCKTHPARNKSDESVPGHRLLFELCVFLVRRLELSNEKAFEILDAHYNTRCQPPWKAKEVVHKLEDARTKVDDIPGYPSAQLEAIFNAPINKTHLVSAVAGATTKQDTTLLASQGKLAPLNLADLCSMLRTADDWANVWRYDEFNHKIIALDPPIDLAPDFCDEDVTRMRLYFQNMGFKVSKDDMFEALAVIARANPYHPVKDYLESLDSNEPGVIQRIAYQALGVKTPVEVAMLRKWLVQAVRRVYEPGCQADHMLVLYGKQAAGKSTFGRVMFGDWFSDQMPKNLDDKDASYALHGCWCIEIAELASMKKSEVEDIKAFITRRAEKYRPAYGRTEVVEPRQCVLFGTTNMREILQDSTGSRRFWILEVSDKTLVEVQHMIALLEELRDAAWAEAHALYIAGETQFFEDETQVEAVREAFQEIDEWTGLVHAYVKGKSEIQGAIAVWRAALTGEHRDLDYRNRKRINDILRRIGCIEKVRKVNGVNTRVWSVPEHLQEVKTVTIVP